MSELKQALGILAAWAKAHPPIPHVKGECTRMLPGCAIRCGKPAKFPVNDNPEDADFMLCAEHYDEHMAWQKKMGFDAKE